MTRQIESWVSAAVERAERRARGEDPFAPPKAITQKKRRRTKSKSGTVTLPIEDYKRLLEAAECDDMISECEVCGAWLDTNDPAFLRSDDFTGCVYYCTGLERDKALCRRYRALKVK